MLYHLNHIRQSSCFCPIQTARIEGTMFLEPLAAQFVPKWPAALYDLMSGKTNFEDRLV